MRIVVDQELCDGHGMCEALAHEFFELDDDVMRVLDESPPESERATVHAAVQSCPALALSLQD